MNFFDRLVEQAMQSDGALGLVRPAVEKELLHHDILREMNRAGLLDGLTFVGGTCLRACYGSLRLSEDLDFTGGEDFNADRLAELGGVLERTLMEKYGLPVYVSEPVREEGNTSTWKLRVQTRPASAHLPAQRIHIDVCALNSHQAHPAFLMNRYGIDLGTEGLVLQAQSREEILADKWVALALRPNRMKYRDLWDISWLSRQGVLLEVPLVFSKLNDRKKSRSDFSKRLKERVDALVHDPQHAKLFRQEMERFLFVGDQREALGHSAYWTALAARLREQSKGLI